jgi:hypothetical protein
MVSPRVFVSLSIVSGNEMKFKTIQSIVTFRNGDKLKSDIVTREEVIQNFADNSGIDVDSVTEKDLQEHFNTLKNMLSQMKEVLYIELRTT